MLRLTATRVADYFRYGCERQLRYDLVPRALREGSGVPHPEGETDGGAPIGPRPGARLIAAEGRRWEHRTLRKLLRRLPDEQVRLAGWTEAGAPRRLPAEEVLAALREPGPVRALVQPELRLADPARFAARYGLDAERLVLAPAVPDLIRIRVRADGRRRFEVIDIKASQEGKAAHYAQVAYYVLLLEEICRAAGVEGGAPDARWGRLWLRDGIRRFALGAYRHHVEKLLREELPRIAGGAPAASRWHLAKPCAGCTYFRHCKEEADASDDLARVPGITPLAKRVLHERGIRTTRDLVKQGGRRGVLEGCNALESQAGSLQQRAMAVSWGKLFPLRGATHRMPAAEDVRVCLSAEHDPVTGLCFALGMRVDAREDLGDGRTRTRVWLAEQGSEAAEGAMLRSLLDRLDALLREVDARNRGRSGRGAGPRPLTLHVYVWDRAEFELMRDLVLRHLSGGGSGPLVAGLLRFVAPNFVAAQPDLARSSPGTLLAEAVADLFALPVPYTYDLGSVSERLQPDAAAAAFRPRWDYRWPFSSQIAWERIHDVWGGRANAAHDGEDVDAVRDRIRDAVHEKLAAVDSVVRAVRQRATRGERLQMRKQAFSLRDAEPTLDDAALETLRVFVELESVAQAVSTRALHALPAEERARRFECIRGMELAERPDERTLVFTFHPDCRDAKFRPGDFNLVLTNDDGRTLLRLDERPWQRRQLMAELLDYDLRADPPRLRLAVGSGFVRAEQEKRIDLDRVCVLDRAPSDFSTERVVGTLRALADGAGEAALVRALLDGREPEGWAPGFTGADAVFEQVLGAAARGYGRPVLNADQEAAWRAAFERPLTVVWGPPGTGKTYLLAWMLIGVCAAARREGRACRILVTAATHRAVVNVLSRLDAELRASGIERPLRAVKLRGSGNEADRDLHGSEVDVVEDRELPALLERAEQSRAPLVVGSTVWSLWKQMRGASRDAGHAETPVRPWFDVAVIDEASQIKVAESLIALSSLRAGGQAVLCGDDRQLAPVIRGSYPAEAGSLFGSAFAHFAERFERLPLRESRRMNRALVAYPRHVHYPGLVSRVPERRIAVDGQALASEAERLLFEAFLAPDDAVVLCTYRGVRAAARNPFEAALAARLVELARRTLRDPTTGRPHTAERFVADAVAVIAPHRAQNSAIYAELGRGGLAPDELPVVDTVERMQGNERDLILVSYGVADREYAEAEAEFLLDPHRFNVSITRPRAKLILLLSEEVLDALPADETVLTGSMALKGYARHCRDAERELDVPLPDGGTQRVRCRYRRLAPSVVRA